MMDPCTVCEETDYHELDGSYFCSTCATKYEGAKDMETETDFANKNLSYTLIKPPKNIGNVGYTRVKKIKEQGRWWSRYDLFQIILLQQVRALISMGAQPELKNLVFGLWVKYLSTIGIAFCEDRVDRAKRTPKPAGKKGRKKTGKSPSADTFKEPTELFGAADDDDDDDETDETDEEEEKTFQDESDKHIPPKYRMRYDFTLAFCYLGLMYTNPMVQISDLLRWVREYRIPFLNTRDYLPEDVKLSPHENNCLFGYDKRVNHDRLRKRVCKLIFLLQLTDFPDIGLDLLIKKYILFLNLPADMCRFSWKLVGSQRVQAVHRVGKRVILTHLEVLALSYIIVILKILFGLNDNTERKLMELTNHKHNLFVFDDWLKFMKQDTAISRCTTLAGDSVKEYGSITSRPESASNAAAVFTPLASLSQLWTSLQAGNQPRENPTPDDSNSVSHLGRRHREKEHFRNSSIQYILQPDTFLRSLDNFNFTEVTVNSILDSSEENVTFVENCNHGNNVMTDNEIGNHSDSFGFHNKYSGTQVPMFGKTEGDISEVMDVSDRVNADTSKRVTNNVDDLDLGRFKNTDKGHGIVQDGSRVVCDSSEVEKMDESEKTRGNDRDILRDTDCDIDPLYKRCKTSDKLIPELDKFKSPLRTFLFSNISVTSITDQKQYDNVIQRIQYACHALHINYPTLLDHMSFSFDDVLTMCSNFTDLPVKEILSQVVKTETLIINGKV